MRKINPYRHSSRCWMASHQRTLRDQCTTAARKAMAVLRRWVLRGSTAADEVSAIRFTDLMKKTVLEPLGMQLGTFEQALLNKRAAQGRERTHRRQNVTGNVMCIRTSRSRTVDDPSDLARFCNEIQRAYSGQRSALISPQLAREMVTSQIQTDFGGMGLGLAQTPTRSRLYSSIVGRTKGSGVG